MHCRHLLQSIAHEMPKSQKKARLPILTTENGHHAAQTDMMTRHYNDHSRIGQASRTARLYAIIENFRMKQRTHIAEEKKTKGRDIVSVSEKQRQFVFLDNRV
jgi:hypothetical protein